ncbi:conserved hypothetical protein [Pediculus humanus corporis]|uniref:Uncharacterized protein n=1 Tax=Pediculus humanus subsp. corporis TaxID=121224 RepID=E0VEX5_PEDHC|nr:uncharacterized protein Phum_PHUM146240 [Pediculus humanus corporis]EEB11949.1 conserved hypothetical protein [Pediculus humanus corporis]
MIKPAFLPQEPSFIPAPQIISQPIQTEQLIPAEQFLRGEPIFRSEPLIRSEQIIRTEPLIRREPIIRAPQIIRNEPIFQNGPVFPSESAPYTIMVTPKGFRPITEKVQISSVPVQLPIPVPNPQEISATFNTEPIQFTSNMNNFQNPAPVQEHTPDPLTTPVTPRSPVPQVPNRFPIPQLNITTNKTTIFMT